MAEGEARYSNQLALNVLINSLGVESIATRSDANGQLQVYIQANTSVDSHFADETHDIAYFTTNITGHWFSVQMPGIGGTGTANNCPPPFICNPRPPAPGFKVGPEPRPTKPPVSFGSCMTGQLIHNFIGDDDTAGVSVAVHVAAILARKLEELCCQGLAGYTRQPPLFGTLMRIGTAR